MSNRHPWAGRGSRGRLVRDATKQDNDPKAIEERVENRTLRAVLARLEAMRGQGSIESWTMAVDLDIASVKARIAIEGEDTLEDCSEKKDDVLARALKAAGRG